MNTDQLLASIKRTAYLGLAGPPWSDAEILLVADETTVDAVLPSMLDARESYLAQTYTIPIVAGQATYRLPPRASGGTVLWVRYQDSTSASIVYPLPHADETDLVFYPQLPMSPYASPWYFDGDHLVLVSPPVAAQGSLVVRYSVRPSRLVPATGGTLSITAVADRYNFTVSAAPSTVGISAGSVIDVVAVDGIHDFRVLSATVSLIVGPIVTLDSSTGTGLFDQRVGDLFSLAQTTSVPNFPDEVHPFLALCTAARLCRRSKDFGSAQALEGEAQEMRGRVFDLIAPRAQKQQKRAINRFGPIRSRRGMMPWWW